MANSATRVPLSEIPCWLSRDMFPERDLPPQILTWATTALTCDAAGAAPDFAQLSWRWTQPYAVTSTAKQ
eukprot:5594817-Pyramimonas_sp.AAC.1